MARPALTAPAAYGVHLASLRQAAGLTQQQLADAVSIKQSNIAFWERASKPPRGEVLPALAAALGVSIEQLLDVTQNATNGRRGPASRLEKLMEQAAQLPRRRQQRIADTLEALLAQEAKAS
jgi:transcriptional regulator with XRE-family HTH domain